MKCKVFNLKYIINNKVFVNFYIENWNIEFLFFFLICFGYYN